MREETQRRREETQKRWEETQRRWEESDRRWEETKASIEESRELTREVLLRNEKVYKGVIVRMEEMGVETRASTAQIHSNTEETKAHTRALLKVLDRLDRIDGSEAA
ncbi:MAG: hypothetical protein H0X42_11305 [Solirubrobacterales bacterium]|nr:hypothetical protein [Solirubrobacterales bacterium]